MKNINYILISNLSSSFHQGHAKIYKRASQSTSPNTIHLNPNLDNNISPFITRNRALISEHPSTPMREGESRTFTINSKYFTKRPGREHCRLFPRAFTVLKKKVHIKDFEADPLDQTLFFAVSGRIDFQNITDGNNTHTYEHQVASIRCIPGFIEGLEVFEKSLEPEGMLSFPPAWPGVRRKSQNSRGCGIGIVLTELCLIDPEFNNMDSKNKAKTQLLKNIDKDGYELLSKTCVKLVGLVMSATPVGAAHVYFSAADRMGYGKLGIAQPTRLNIYETSVARKNFNAETGIIQACCEEKNECSAVWRTWYFCEENREADPFAGFDDNFDDD